MNRQELANEIAKGLIATGIEGSFDSVSCSTAGDYPSCGCSQWEGGRANALLENIEGGEYYSNRSYSDIKRAGELPALRNLLGSDSGRKAQLAMLSTDCLTYVDELQLVPTLDDSRVLIYCGMWCPTSTYVVVKFLQRRWSTFNLRSLAAVTGMFRDRYWVAADVGDTYKRGYENRADRTYEYVKGLDLAAYGVPNYGYYGL